MQRAAAHSNKNHFAELVSMIRVSPAIAGAVLAWIAVIIYAASNSVVTLLVDIGEANPLSDGSNAITYTNLLLLGTLVSVVPLAILFRHELTPAAARRIGRRDWGLMTVSAFLSSALTPALFFYALAHTTVTNVLMISRIEPPLFLLAAFFLLNERFRTRALVASLIALAGAMVIIGWRDGGGMAGLGHGEWAAVAATVSYVASTIVSRAGLMNVPLGIFAVYRSLAGAAIYFTAVTSIYGPEAFSGIFSPVMWTWIWVYAGLVIVLGQITWALALKHANAADLSLATSFSPLAGILIAMLLLGEDPGAGLLPGAAIILFSIVIGRAALSGSGSAREEGVIHPALATPALWLRDAGDVTGQHILNVLKRVVTPRNITFYGMRPAPSPIVAGAPPGGRTRGNPFVEKRTRHDGTGLPSDAWPLR